MKTVLYLSSRELKTIQSIAGDLQAEKMSIVVENSSGIGSSMFLKVEATDSDVLTDALASALGESGACQKVRDSMKSSYITIPISSEQDW
jgi:hypothetical protein